MAKDKEIKAESKCDPVKELARGVFCALIGSNETTDDVNETAKKAYEIANAFENYKN